MKSRLIWLFLAVMTILPAKAMELPDLPEKDGMNVKGYVHDGVNGLEGVLVSDGYSFVKTAADGSYYMTKSTKATEVFVIIPSGYRLADAHVADGGVARFFRTLSTGDVTTRADFELTAIGDDTNFSFLVYADTQPYPGAAGPNYFQKMQVGFTDMTKRAKEIETKEGFPTFALHLGDIIYRTNKSQYEFPPYIEAVKETGYNVTTFATPGNHDRDWVVTYKLQTSLYREVWGPVYFSFNRGKVHFISMDDVDVVTDGAYIRRFRQDAIDWLKKDLEYVVEGSQVVFITHQPVTNSLDATNFKTVLDILSKYKTMIMTGHNHQIINSLPIYNENIRERVHVALGGYEWRDVIAQDGVPNGYVWYTFNGDKLTWKFVKTGGDPDKDMFSVYLPGEHGLKRPAESEPAQLMINAWDRDDNGWKMEYSIDGGQFSNMTQLSWETLDPYAVELYGSKAMRTYRKLYTCDVDRSKASTVKIRVTDAFGRTSTQDVDVTQIQNAGADDDYHGFRINAGQALIDNPHLGELPEAVFRPRTSVNMYALYQPEYRVITPNETKTAWTHGSTTGTLPDNSFTDFTMGSDPDNTSSVVDCTESAIESKRIDGAVLDAYMGDDGLAYVRVPEKYYKNGQLTDVPAEGGDLRIRLLMHYADKGRINDSENMRTNDITGVYATVNAPSSVITTVNFVQANTSTAFNKGTGTYDDKLGAVQRTAVYTLGSTKGAGPEDLKYEGMPGACDNLMYYARKKNTSKNNDKYAFPLTAVDIVFKGVKPGQSVGWTNLQTLYDGYIPTVYQSSGVDDAMAEDEPDAEPEYYNLQGIRVMNPEHGIYIERRGSKVRKIMK